MQRTVVPIARIRIGDLERGDVVNGRPDAELGGFMVLTKRELPSGELVVSGESSSHTVKGHALDLVGVQVTKQVEVQAAQQPEVVAEAS